MVEVYTNNATVVDNSNVPLNNVVVEKGCTAKVSATSSVNLHKCGVYEVCVDACGYTLTTAGLIGLQLIKNGIPQSQAVSNAYSGSNNVSGTVSVSFETLVQVPQNDSGCCTSPTTINIQNVGEDAVWSHVSVTITKIC